MAEDPLPQTRAEELVEAAIAALRGDADDAPQKVSLVVTGFPAPISVDRLEWFETDPPIVSATRSDGAQVLFGEADLRAVILIAPREAMPFV